MEIYIAGFTNQMPDAWAGYVREFNRENDPDYKEETQSNEWVEQFNKRTNPNNY